MAKKQMDVHPDVLKAVSLAVDKAVANRLEGMNLLDLKECQEQLKATRAALIDMQQNFDVWRKLAELRGEQSEQRGAQIDELQKEVTALHVEIAMLRSALENGRVEGGGK
jgi:uncharacterized coiled-coil DUF342 family protein